ncbi:hypothetical protein [uncultured Jannaschia sp.]|uniref:hypothetical protein n=1 Tax=uncultured Jannaschia sp. TaxID=293347 RepID=UPI0026044BAB|nr:hypothetical protein [uncultured Jannaschia sp.]
MPRPQSRSTRSQLGATTTTRSSRRERRARQVRPNPADEADREAYIRQIEARCADLEHIATALFEAHDIFPDVLSHIQGIVEARRAEVAPAAETRGFILVLSEHGRYAQKLVTRDQAVV